MLEHKARRSLGSHAQVNNLARRLERFPLQPDAGVAHRMALHIMPHKNAQTDGFAGLGDDFSIVPHCGPKKRHLVQNALRRAVVGRTSPPSSNHARKKIATLRHRTTWQTTSTPLQTSRAQARRAPNRCE
eukprot:1455068-Pyramimonas_sp.AAC.1